MGRNKQTITDREKAAIYLHLYGGVEDWKQLYNISRPGEVKTDPKDIIYLSDVASKWKHSQKIQDFLQQAQETQTRKKIAIEEKARQEERRSADNERTDNKRPAATVDYYDPKNQRTQINRIIQEASDDPRTQLDAIKAIQQTQRDDKQAAKDQQIQRFYSPVRCNICPIRQDYEKRQARKTTK